MKKFFVLSLLICSIAQLSAMDLDVTNESSEESLAIKSDNPSYTDKTDVKEKLSNTLEDQRIESFKKRIKRLKRLLSRERKWLKEVLSFYRINEIIKTFFVDIKNEGEKDQLLATINNLKKQLNKSHTLHIEQITKFKCYKCKRSNQVKCRHDIDLHLKCH